MLTDMKKKILPFGILQSYANKILLFGCKTNTLNFDFGFDTNHLTNTIHRKLVYPDIIQIFKI